MRSEHTFEETIAWQPNYRKMLSIDVKLKTNNNDEEYLWDSDKMSFAIMDDMQGNNEDSGFNFIFNYAKYMAIRLKFTKDETVKNLLLDFYKYREYHYDAVIYGIKIFDYCKEHHCSYIVAIADLAHENENLDKKQYDFEKGRYCSGGHMKWSVLNEDGSISFTEPTHTVAVTDEERTALYKKLAELDREFKENKDV